MTYSAKYPTAVHSFILSLMLVQGIYQLIQANYGRGSIQIAIGFVIAFSYFIRYQIQIKTKSLKYEVMFCNICIFSKDISYNDIRRIEFKQMGRSSRGAFIFTQKLFPVRLVNFKPETMYDELHVFGKRNLLTIVTKDDIHFKQKEMTKES